jgi:hypothetical protein
LSRASHDEFIHTVVIPDCQLPFIDRAAEAAAMQYVSETAPDQLIILGDFVDFTSIGTYRNRLPIRQRLSFEEELDLGKRKLAEWAALAPKAKRIFLEGNHEDRAARYILDNAEQLGFLKLPDLLGMKDWIYAGSYADGAGVWVGKRNGLWATHGQVVAKHSGWSARAHLDLLGRSVIHGHSHRLGAYYVLKGDTAFAAFEAGTLCDFARTPRSVPTVNWQHGLASVYTSRTSPRFSVELISINQGAFVSGGRRYGR